MNDEPSAAFARRLAVLALAALVFSALPVQAQILGELEAYDHFGSAVGAGDFDGDGFLDLAVGAFTENVGSVQTAGAVNVLYGTADGLSTLDNQFWTQDSPGITGNAEGGDGFGEALASGDFDGDGYDDIAIGVPSENVAGVFDAGALHVLYGSAAGLTADRDQFWSQGSPGVEDDVEMYDSFGSALIAGDFNGDGHDDLAVGVERESLGTAFDAGAVHVLYCAANGLTANGDQFWHQNSPGVADEAELNDAFGSALARGDFNGDGHDDLAVGVHNETIAEGGDGAVNVLYGSAAGLSAPPSRLFHQFFHQGQSGVLDEPERGDNFGQSLAVGDFDGDGYDDLAVGVPDEDLDTITDAGAVSVLYGTDRGLRTPGNQLWHQDSPNVLDTAESDDRFGYALVAGDFDGDGFADLAFGVPEEDYGTVNAAGAMNAFYGTASGLSALDNQFWHQDSPGILDQAQNGDEFGHALAAGDLNGNGRDDLAIGIHQEDVTGVNNAGAVSVLYGVTSPGLSAAGNEFWHQGATSLLAGDAATSAVTEQPAALALDAPYPNPFNPSRSGALTLAFALPEPGLARLAVYDVTGRRVAVAADGTHAAGRHTLTWDGIGVAGALPSGVYVLRLEVGDPAGGAGGRVLVRPLTVLR
jgi:hypothetical protein